MRKETTREEGSRLLKGKAKQGGGRSHSVIRRDYQYETGDYLELPMRWDEKNAKLEFGSARGAFLGAPGKRTFTVRYPGRTETVRIDPD